MDPQKTRFESDVKALKWLEDRDLHRMRASGPKGLVYLPSHPTFNVRAGHPILIEHP
ncbi:hypothetical protein Plhal304r1_c007g0028711 [Plasmopara halstedii]